MSLKNQLVDHYLKNMNGDCDISQRTLFLKK